MNPITVLLVEDNLSDIELTQIAFEKALVSNELQVVEDGQEALDYLFGCGSFTGRNVTQTPKLILLDLKLPGLDGLEVLECIRTSQTTRQIPVVILTSSIEEKDVRAAYDLGANSYIRKPVDFRQFTEVIQNLTHYWLVINHVPPDR
jgi:two-component system, response regulator